jgi:protein-S-isoprenylcysteine O-methyltransferase Ste14
MFLLIRAFTYAVLLTGVLLIFLPARILLAVGILHPQALGAPQIAGMGVGAAAAAVVIWCVWNFAVIGRGTPAVFDPPRRLVVRGPYRYVRNPMYIGAALAVTGAAIFYESLALLAYASGFILLAHLFVIAYEERTLRKQFGDDYAGYCRRVRRWIPGVNAR